MASEVPLVPAPAQSSTPALPYLDPQHTLCYLSIFIGFDDISYRAAVSDYIGWIRLLKPCNVMNSRGALLDLLERRCEVVKCSLMSEHGLEDR